VKQEKLNCTREETPTSPADVDFVHNRTPMMAAVVHPDLEVRSCSRVQKAFLLPHPHPQEIQSTNIVLGSRSTTTNNIIIGDVNVITHKEGNVKFLPAIFWYFFFSMVQQPLVGQGHLIIEASRSHSDTHTHTR
jgi:hypothetical protein